MSWWKTLKSKPKDFLLFFLVVALFGFSQSVVDSVLNNYLNEVFHLTNLQRTFLEIPRELPGFLVAIIGVILFFISYRRLAVLANLVAAAGALLLAFLAHNLELMLTWLFVYSVGLHIFMPLNSSIGLELAQEGKFGRRLGQLSSANNAAAIIGSFVVFLGFKYFNLDFKLSFIIAAAGFIAAGVLLYLMKKDKPVSVSVKLKFRKEYTLYYWLTVLFGMRKQIFLTFAPWVLVTVFEQKTASIATLITIGGVIGIGFKPLLGSAIDKFGEKFILMGEAALLIFVCVGYGFSRDWFPGAAALIIASTCYVMDQLLMAAGMARDIYLKKIAHHEEEVASALSMAVSIDHIFSISIALAGGAVWSLVGYQYVFLGAAVIAFINLISASFIRIPVKSVPH